MAVNPKAVALETLTTLIDTGGQFDGAKVGLFQEPITPTPDTVLADLTPCDFDGYALSSALTWGTPFYGAEETAQVPAGLKQFIATGSTTPNNVWGWYVVDGAGTTLLLVEPFEDAIPVLTTGEGVALVPTLVMPLDIFV